MTRCFIALVLAALAAGSFGCVSQTGMDRANEQIRIRDSQIAELKSRIEQLNGELDILRGQREDANSLRLALEGAQSDNQRLKELLDDARRQIAELAKQGPALPAAVDAALQELAARNPGLMTYDPKRGMIRFASDLTFDLGKATVKSDAAASLNQLAAIINTPLAQPYDVRIEGHTDDVPVTNPANKAKYEDNWGLSAFRAIAVQRVLKSAGVAPQRMIVAGRGEFHPLVPSQGPKGTRANRRVEIYLVPSPRDNGAAGGVDTGGGAAPPETGGTGTVGEEAPPPPETFK